MSSSSEKHKNIAIEMSNGSDSSKKTSPVSPKDRISQNVLWSRQIIKQDRRHVMGPVTSKAKIYNFLERPEGYKCITYHCAVFLMVLSCLVFSVLSTVKEVSVVANEALFWMEIWLVAFLTTEYMIRIWSAGCRGKYQGFCGRIKFIRKPICIIDAVIIASSLFVLFVGSNGHVFAASAVRGVRFLQILRMLRVDRQGGTWRLLGSVIYVHRMELITTSYIGFLGLIFSSYFIYLAEKDVQGDNGQSDFESYADALWWGVATYTTIGYGDKVPRTWAGRAVTCFFSLIIISFITLPSGILGSGFALKVQQKQRQKHFSRQFPAAAFLIQCAWRCHVTESPISSSATWKIHLQTSKYEVLSKKKLSGYLRKKQRPRSESFTPDIKKKGEKRHSGGQDNYAFNEVSTNDMHTQSTSSLNETKLDSLNTNDVNSGAESMDEVDYENEQPQRVTVLTETHKNAIRAIRKMQFSVARRNFTQAKKPYDVQDVIEQYSQGHLNMMFRIKELQRRLERTIGKPSAPNPMQDKGAPKATTMLARLLRIEHKLNVTEKKLDQVLAIISSPREAS